MGKFNRDDRGGSRGGFGGNRGGGSSFGGGREFRRNDSGGSRFGGDRGEVTMHDAVCDECKKNCKVPFRPSSDKPIYCSDCFTKRGGPAKLGSDFPRRDFNSPRPQRSESSFSAPRMQDDGVKKQLEAISAKLDTLIKTLTPVSKSAPVEAKVESKKTPVVVEAKVEVKKVSKAKAKVVVAKKKTTKK